MMRTTQMESSLFLGQKKAHWAELKGGSRWRTHLWSHIARGRENETMLIHDTSQRFGLFEHASMCNQKGGVKIQNRGPEQEIPAVTCVRLIAQETSILAPWIVRYSTDIGKINWNWCFHSSAAGRVSSEEGNFDQLTNQTMPQIFEWKIGQQKGKSQKAESWKLPLFLRCLNVIVKWLGGGVLF